MKAEEARKLTEANSDALTSKEYSAIMKKVKAAAEKGMNRAYLQTRPSGDVTKRLANDGYKIDGFHDQRDGSSEYYITW